MDPVVLICTGCGVAFWKRDKCPSCGAVGRAPRRTLRQLEPGTDMLCSFCSHREACRRGDPPEGVDLRRFGGSVLDDAMCWTYDELSNQNASLEPLARKDD